mmetsp:Transcript_3056/g.5476  ORF Transcript_3056/g.5476 Transcript_3056/m.5476 type:complete len:106 (-) Transcript_3056:1162-1479(-)
MLFEITGGGGRKELRALGVEGCLEPEGFEKFPREGGGGNPPNDFDCAGEAFDVDDVSNFVEIGGDSADNSVLPSFSALPKYDDVSDVETVVDPSLGGDPKKELAS